MSALLEALGIENPPDLWLFWLVLARLAPVIALTPVFGGQATPARYRIALGLLFSGVMFASLEPAKPTATTFLEWAQPAARELLFGITIAFAIRLIFDMTATIGELIDLARGATFANVLDPVNQQQSSLLASFLMKLQLALFFAIGGHRFLLGALQEGFQSWPPGLDQLTRQLSSSTLTTAFLDILSHCFSFSLRVAAPALASLFIVNIAMALMNRSAPQVQVFFLAMPLRAALGILALLLTLHEFARELFIHWDLTLNWALDT